MRTAAVRILAQTPKKVVDFSKDDVTALSFQINGETVSFTKTAGDDDTDIWTYDQEDGFPTG